jgi:hypothetical protein
MATTQNRSAGPEQSNRRQQERWEARLPVVLAMAAVGVVGVHYIPAYPYLAQVVAVWELLCFGTFWVLTKQAKDDLGPVRVSDVVYRPNGISRVVGRWRPGVGGLYLVCATASLTSLVAGISIFGSLPTVRGLNSALLCAAVSLACAGAFVVEWYSRGAAVQANGLQQTLWGALALGLGMTFLAVVPLQSAGPGLVFQGSPGAWTKVVALAQQEADRRVPGVVLESVWGYPAGSAEGPGSSEMPLAVEFGFRSAEIRSFLWAEPTIDVSVLDSDPPRLLDEYESSGRLVPIKPAEVARRLSAVRLGPRDVYRLTQQVAVQFAQAANIEPNSVFGGLSPYVALYLNDEGQASNSSAPGWSVVYSFERGADPWRLSLTIDSATGAIVQCDTQLPGDSQACSQCSQPTR